MHGLRPAFADGRRIVGACMRTSVAFLSLALLCFAVRTDSQPVAAYERPAIAAGRTDASGRRHFDFSAGGLVSFSGMGEEIDPGSKSWSGRLENGAGTFVAIEERNRLFARIHLPDRSFEFLPSDDGPGLRVIETDHRLLPDRCGVGQPTETAALSTTLDGMGVDPCEDANAAMLNNPPPSDPCPTVPSSAIPARIAVMSVYTPAVENKYGSAGVIALTNLSIAETNAAFRASKVNARTYLPKRGCWLWPKPCVYKVAYAEAGTDLRTDLDRLLLDGDGHLDDVRSLRNACRADLAILLVNDSTDHFNGRSCPMNRLSHAYGEYAMGVALAASAAATFTFTHELTHMMGAGHENATAAGHLCTYSSAAAFTVGPDRFTTVTYSNSTGRVLCLSGPDVLCQGTTTGSAAADNARTLRISAPTVAAFK